MAGLLLLLLLLLFNIVIRELRSLVAALLLL